MPVTAAVIGDLRVQTADVTARCNPREFRDMFLKKRLCESAQAISLFQPDLRARPNTPACGPFSPVLCDRLLRAAALKTASAAECRETSSGLPRAGQHAHEASANDCSSLEPLVRHYALSAPA
jgi:hypothetical protein